MPLPLRSETVYMWNRLLNYISTEKMMNAVRWINPETHGFQNVFPLKTEGLLHIHPPPPLQVFQYIMFYIVLCKHLSCVVLTSWVALSWLYHHRRGLKCFLIEKCHRKPIRNYNAMYIHRTSWQSTSLDLENETSYWAHFCVGWLCAAFGYSDI